jgi:hypothetical protein
MSGIAAGWYDDGHGAIRYWNGDAWTEHVAPEQHVAPATAPAQASVAPAVARADQPTDQPAAPSFPSPDPTTMLVPPPAPRRRRVWPWVVGGVAAVVLVGGGIVGAVVVATTILERGDVFAESFGPYDDRPAAGVPAAPAPDAAAPTPDAPIATVAPEELIGFTSTVDLTANGLLAADAYDRFNSSYYAANCDVFFSATSTYFREGWIDTCDDLLDEIGGAPVTDPMMTATITEVTGFAEGIALTVEEDYEGFGTAVGIYYVVVMDGVWQIDGYDELSSPESPAA